SRLAVVLSLEAQQKGDRTLTDLASTSNIKVQNVPQAAMTADVLLTTLVECGAEYLFVNLGTDHTSIIEAVARFDVFGWRRPKVILCPHESVALSMAHGYSLLHGRAQAVLVHVDVG